MHFTHINSWLHILLACSLFGLLLASTPISSNLACPYEPLPDNLDTLSGLGFNGELHIHNDYYAQFSRGQNHLINFTLYEQSAFRMYVEPHYVDIDIWLYKDLDTITHTSDYSLADEVIWHTLEPGTYRIRIYFFGTFTGDCPTMATEISIVPTSRLTSRVNSYSCPSSQILPSIGVSQVTVDGFTYDSTTNTSVFNAQYTPSPNTAFQFLQSYIFTLPRINGNGDTWEIEAVLGFHFPTSALGLLLQNASQPTPTSLACYDAGNCSIAAHNVRGQNTLKALVLPGTYVLWLYDVPRDRNTSLVQCNPFTMSLTINHAQQVEDFLNCAGEIFPNTTLAQAGLMDESGYMYYREDILVDLSVQINPVQFTVTNESYFRAYAAAHRIDIDLRLLNASGSLAYGYGYGSAEEGIQYYLYPGNYTFQLIYFGTYDAMFCETALIEIAIAPKSLYTGFDVCTGQTASSPDLSGLTGLMSNPNYKLNGTEQTYRYLYQGNYQEKVIASQTFNLSTDSYIQAQLGSNFILGDIRIWLSSTTLAGSTRLLGYHRRNLHYLDVFVPASANNRTQYTISIVTSATQSVGITGFPACATYSLSLTVTPANATAPQQCLQNRLIPSSLNTPQNLNTSPKIHIQEEFLIPYIASLYAVESITFTVTTPSYFRMYTEPHHIDIDLKLQENATTVAQNINFNDEEALAWIVKPGNKYTLTITYYKWYFIDHGNDPCYTYQAELAITPITGNITSNCITTKLPSDLDVLAKDAPVNLDGDFYFNQSNDSRDFTIKFTVPSPSLFRALVSFDFVWSDLALQLTLPGSSDPVRGELRYNKHEISTVQLAPGNYTLHIYEPFPTNVGRILSLRNCVNFHLTIGLEVIANDEIDPLLLSCSDQYFPANWNTPALISNLTGNNVDFDQYVLADVTARTDNFTFIVNTTSVFRIYIPAHFVLDVDVFLYRTVPLTLLASQVSYGKEEFIQIRLSPGSYLVKFNYYGVVSVSILPPASACTAFRVQISVYDENSLSSTRTLPSACVTSFLPTIDTTVATNTVNFSRSLEQQIQFYSYALFTIKTTYQFTVKFEQNDVSSGIAMLLQAMNVSKTYNPLYFLNHVYLNEYLPAGTYNLSFHDPSGTTRALFLCAPYTLTYTLAISDIPADVCTADALPTSLIHVGGGSTPFGGPQAADGYIHFYGNNFVMAKGARSKDNYILFNVPTKSYLRLFLVVENGNTVTANVFMNTNLTAAAPLASTTAANSFDRSNVWVLPGQQAPYVLDLYFSVIGSVVDCNYFTFEFVLEPETTVLSGLACPNPLPSELNQLPPETIDVFAQQDYFVSSDQFLVTSEKFFNNHRGGSYSYTMTLNVASNSSLSALISYDFLVNEFALVLQDSNGRNITVGIHQESPSTDSSFNFINYLQWKLAPGTYRLVIVDVGVKNWNLTAFCHFFSFTLAVSAIDQTNPRILQVLPSSGSNLDPKAPLSLVLIFSEAAYVVLPPNYALTPYLADYGVVYLKGSMQFPSVTASDAYFDLSNSQLNLRFEGNFAEGAAYNLVVDNTKFFTLRNTTAAFQPGALTFGHNYLMHNCQGACNHGECALSYTTNTWVCVCYANWTGPACDRCVTGFHGAGLQCVPNSYCSNLPNNDSCNTHGRCSDAAGYPVCSCRIGYTGAACELCAVGYLGYPNCTLNSTDLDEPASCTLPLLPNYLNTPGFLSYTGHLHVQGFYYVNQDLRMHDTTFTLTQTSLFRVYTEPHEIDIDIWLYKVADNGDLSSVTYRISFGLEETILLKLDPANYLLRFRYYTWVVPSSDCVSFGLEWAIAPLISATAESANLSYYCGASDNLPQLPSLTSVSAPFTFSQSGFTINAPVLGTPPTTKPNYFYRLNITIVPPTPTQLATLHATLGYRFLQGDVSLLLESGNTGTHCDNLGSVALTPPPGCAYGDNLGNTNTLHRFLEAGDYILWIYEPVRQLPEVSSCSPFDFSLTIDFVDDEQDIFNCNLPLIPLSLDSTQFTETPGYIHFRDFFVLDQRNMSFTVSQQSLLRVAVTGTDVTVALYNSVSAVVTTNGDSQSILVSLAPGKYHLQFATDIFQFCPVLALEFALAPVNNPVSVVCPPAASNPPSLDITSYPFEFAPSRQNPTVLSFVTLNSPSTPIVTSYTFRLASTGYLDTGVESDFLRGNLRLEVYNTDFGLNLVGSGYNNYNYNHLQQVLQPGNYELRIVLPPGQRIAGIPSCIEYSFDLRIWYTTPTNPVCPSNHLPYSFNTKHFLGYDGKMNYQSNNWRVPSFQISASHSVNFTVPAQSLIRVYTEPHNIDIDIKLLTNTGVLLTSGSNAIGTEESFTYMLQPNVIYLLQLQFYNFGAGGIGPCETFNMEVEIGPIPPRQAVCNNTGSLWPPSFPSPLTLPYTYNSIDNNMPLYYQQQSKTVVSNLMPFTLASAANVHVEVGYDFLVGDLVLKLYSVTTKEYFYGSNRLDRNVLNLINIPKGSYQLYIYEASANLDSVIGCSAFTFAVYMEDYAAIISEERFLIEYYFPSSLDTIAYLNASNKVHVANDFFMFDGTGAHDYTTFTIKETSLLRVNSLLAESEVASGHFEIPSLILYKSGVIQLVSNASLLTTVLPGSYTLTLVPPTSLTEQDDLGVIVSVQIAINTLTNLIAEIAQSPQQQTCTTTEFGSVLTSPTGFYQNGSSFATVPYSQLSTSTDIVRLPFVLDRFSLVYLQVGSQFLLSELEVRVYSATNTTSIWHGRIRNNINEIHQALPAGSYYAYIRQPQIQATPALAHCGLFSYSIIIKDANNPGTIIDCSTLNQLPWQLDSSAGGSAAYGGPISSDGSLHFYGPNMHVPGQAASSINFTLSKPTLMSALVVGYPSAFSTIDFSLTNSVGTAQSPTQNLATTSDRSRLTQYSLNSASYSLGINYRGAFTVGLCYSYTLQIDIAPAASVQNAVTCPSGITGIPLPTSILLDSGAAYGLTDSFFQGWGAVAGLEQKIAFTTTQSTSVVVTLGYNSLITAFSMKLNSVKVSSTSLVYAAQTKGQPNKSGQTNVYLYIATNVPAGNYSISITHPLLAAPFNNPTQLCAPYIFSYTIGGQAVVTDVAPPSADSISANDNLAITVTFSATIYSATHTPITSVNSSVFLGAFYLSGSNGAQVFPTSAVATSVASQQWTLTFPPLVAQGIVFTLSLIPNQIYDLSGNGITLTGLNKYKTVDCGPHGHFDSSQQKCVCNVGFAGIACDSCDSANGYTAPADAPNLCVKNQCTPTTCGCLDVTSCKTPLGICSTNSSGLAHCACAQNYQGEHCEACKAGYINYPSCSERCNALTCVHGTCLEGVCQCPSNFAGTNCDKCANDFSGENCSNYKSDGSNSDWGATKTFLEVTGVLVIVALAAGAAFWYWRYRRAGSRYKLVSRFNMEDDDDETGHHFPDTDNRLVDDEENASKHPQFSESHEEDDHPRVELPRGAGNINSAPEPFSSSNNPRLLDM